VVLLGADSFQVPDKQLSARSYVALVHVYQNQGRPLLNGIVRCRYKPTCSEYSIMAVQKYGLRHGLLLTAARLWHCRSAVPLGTSDPVR